MNQEHLEHLQGVVAEAQSVVVIVSARKFDYLAAATSLVLGLKNIGKNVYFLSAGEFEGDSSILAGMDQIQPELGNRNLQISFPYDPQAVNKVSYHIDEEAQKFFLVVQPEKNQSPLDSNQVTFSYAGAEADLLFLVGVNSYEELDDLYYGYEEFYQQTQTVALHTFQSPLGTFKFDSGETDSLSGLVYLLLDKFGVEINSDIATNLLAGIEDISDSFHSLSTSPYSFEAAGALMRQGARRIRRRGQKTQENQFVTTGEIIAGKDTPVQLSTSNDSFARAMSKKDTQEGEASAEVPKKQKTTKSKKNKSEDKSKKDETQKPGGLNYQPSTGVSNK